MAKRGRPSKNPYADLDSDYKDAVAAMSVEDIKARMAVIAKDQETNLSMMKSDLHLKEAREAAKEAGAQYKEATKMNRLKIRYAIEMIDTKGGAWPGPSTSQSSNS